MLLETLEVVFKFFTFTNSLESKRKKNVMTRFYLECVVLDLINVSLLRRETRMTVFFSKSRSRRSPQSRYTKVFSGTCIKRENGTRDETENGRVD